VHPAGSVSRWGTFFGRGRLFTSRTRRKGRVIKKEKTMIRRSFQKGHISKRKTKNHGVVYDIRFRVRTAEGKWKQRCETLNALGEGKVARAKAEEILEYRLREANPANGIVMPSNMTLRQFADSQWQQYLDRKAVKPSTRASYRAYLNKHLLPASGDFRLSDTTLLHVGELLSKKHTEGLPHAAFIIFIGS
jgi:hypothetical protein